MAIAKHPRGALRNDRAESANLAFRALRPNRKFSSRSPDQFLAEIADRHPERLVAQRAPMDRALWLPERFQDFLPATRELLAQAVKQRIEQPA